MLKLTAPRAAVHTHMHSSRANERDGGGGVTVTMSRRNVEENIVV